MNVYNVVHNWLRIRAFPKDIWVLIPKILICRQVTNMGNTKFCQLIHPFS